MKTNRNKLRSLIREVLNSHSLNMDYSPKDATASIEMFKGLAEDLQRAMFGVGHDMTMIGKITKVVTGMGTNEKGINSVFLKIRDFAAFDEAAINLNKSGVANIYDHTKPIDVLKHVAMYFNKHNKVTLGEALLDELREGSKDIDELEKLVPGSKSYITGKR